MKLSVVKLVKVVVVLIVYYLIVKETVLMAVRAGSVMAFVMMVLGDFTLTVKSSPVITVTV